MVEAYGLSNAGFVPVPVGQQYAALVPGTAYTADPFATDPQQGGDEEEGLADPELLFGSQNVVMTVDAGKLEVVGEQKFLGVVDAVNRSLTQKSIVDLNAAVTSGQPDVEVSRR